MGGGNTPEAGTNTANGAGRDARSAMDNAMFAVNYFTPLVGAGVAYVDNKLTVQVEATVLELFRVKGDNAATATDSTRTNSTAGIHVGYFVIPQLSFGGELRYQRWLTTPTRLVMGMKTDILDANKDTTSVAIGPRAHFAIGNGMWLRPGISYSRVLDKPLSDASYNMVQVDIPVIF
jgi:opacity protein-like surface antigen